MTSVLLVYNASSPRCGIRNSGDQWATAMRLAGLDVTVWDGTFPDQFNASTMPWWPADLDRYDQVCLLWNPQTINFYMGADRWPATEKGTIWIGETKPWAWCPFQEHFKHVIACDAAEGITEVIGCPVVDWVESPPPDPAFTVGISTVRGEGVSLVEYLQSRYPHWTFNVGTSWLPLEDEIRRLARSTVNVCWYHTGRNERSSAASMCLASGRPLIVNHAPPLQHLHGLPGITVVEQLGDLEAALEQAAADWAVAGWLPTPVWPSVWNWSHVVTRLQQLWEQP